MKLESRSGRPRKTQRALVSRSGGFVAQPIKILFARDAGGDITIEPDDEIEAQGVKSLAVLFVLFRQDLRYNRIIGSRSADRFEVASDLQFIDRVMLLFRENCVHRY